MNDPLLPFPLQVAAGSVLVVLLAWIVRLIRAQQLTLRDSLLWLLSTSAALLATLFPSTLRWVAGSLGIVVPSNALFALALLYLVVNLLGLTITTSRHAAHLRRVTQECTILRAELESLSARMPSSSERPGS